MERSDHEVSARRGFPAVIQRATLADATARCLYLYQHSQKILIEFHTETAFPVKPFSVMIPRVRAEGILRIK
ncbi:MAG: hypothetical protein LBQ54_09530 [Planctomycetaceae bacterium]|jgi:hypothetical protein|nr:hypothetical protein [Planctomycetaceae bacterium]